MGSFYAISNNKNNNNNQTQTQPCATVCLCVCRGHLSSEWPRIACSDHSSPGHPVLPGQVLGGPDGWSGSKLAQVSGSDLEANKGQGRCDSGVCVCLCVSVSMCLCGPCGLGILLLLLLLLLLLSFCFVSIKKSDRVAAGQGSCCYKTDSMFSHHSWSSRL